ncbi:hypothetical protein BS78_01G240300 [Paspalum vaginatum]|nr:hypothetical protein BS78_01G240300 [Paspalum vaginatum]
MDEAPSRWCPVSPRGNITSSPRGSPSAHRRSPVPDFQLTRVCLSAATARGTSPSATAPRRDVLLLVRASHGGRAVALLSTGTAGHIRRASQLLLECARCGGLRQPAPAAADVDAQRAGLAVRDIEQKLAFYFRMGVFARLTVSEHRTMSISTVASVAPSASTAAVGPSASTPCSTPGISRSSTSTRSISTTEAPPPRLPSTLSTRSATWCVAAPARETPSLHPSATSTAGCYHHRREDRSHAF